MPQCDECGFDWGASDDVVIAKVRSVGADYAARFASFHDDGTNTLIRARPEPGVWSALEYVVHMRDVLGFYMNRIERVLTEQRPAMPAVGFSALADARRYRDERLTPVLQLVTERGEEAAKRLTTLSDAQWARVGIGSEGGERTVRVLARRLAHEVDHHRLDIDRLLQAVGGPEKGRS